MHTYRNKSRIFAWSMAHPSPKQGRGGVLQTSAEEDQLDFSVAPSLASYPIQYHSTFNCRLAQSCSSEIKELSHHTALVPLLLNSICA